MNRIYLPPDVMHSSSSYLTGEWHKQVSVVLRSRPGDKFAVVCGDGYEYCIEIGAISGKETRFTIIEQKEKNLEPSLDITLYIGCLKAGGLEELLAPLVYLGVHRVVPMLTERCQGKWDISSGSRQERIQRIIQRATALSGRTCLMQYDEPHNMHQILETYDKAAPGLFFWEEAEQIPLKKRLATLLPAKKINIFTGPEGGFTRDEAEAAIAAGLLPASLGYRILDARTAPVAAVSAVLFATENI